MIADLLTVLGDDYGIERFIPYVCLHEFESLVLAKPDALLREFPESQQALVGLQRDIMNLNPEDINDSPHTAPSKRIIKYFPEYDRHKNISAINTLKGIDLYIMRALCPHFNHWVTSLESLSAP